MKRPDLPPFLRVELAVPNLGWTGPSGVRCRKLYRGRKNIWGFMLFARREGREEGLWLGSPPASGVALPFYIPARKGGFRIRHPHPPSSDPHSRLPLSLAFPMPGSYLPRRDHPASFLSPVLFHGSDVFVIIVVFQTTYTPRPSQNKAPPSNHNPPFAFLGVCP